MYKHHKGNLWCLGAVAWSVLAAGVWAWTTRYEFSTYENDARQTAQPWPTDSSMALAQHRFTLVFFIHPRCPCTRASLGELERTLTGTGLSAAQQPKLNVVVSLPWDASQQWRDTDTVRRASALPRAELVWDAGGSEASRFGVVTSGAVRLYRPDGKLLFAGGVTASRGHEGDNAGSSRLWSLLSERCQTPQDVTPVFGCRLCFEDELTVCNGTCSARLPGGVATNGGETP